MARRDRTDQHFDYVGQFTQKRLPKLRWGRIARPGVSGKTILVVFFGTLVVLALIIVLMVALRT
jgi:hypothetical protein